MSYRGVIFDLDGTLLNTLTSLADSFNRALLTLGYPTHPAKAYRCFIGDGVRKCAERCLPLEASDQTIERCITLQRRNYRQGWRNDTFPYNGIPALLAQLNARGLKLGVLSNKDDEFAQKCVAHFFPDISFDAVVGHSVDIPHKPDRAGGRLITKTFEVRPDEILYVGDSNTDMKTAHACNMIPVGVLWGFRDQRELLDAGAEHIIGQPSQLLDLVKSRTEL